MVFVTINEIPGHHAGSGGGHGLRNRREIRGVDGESERKPRIET